jgi:hypothetical protein
MERKWRTSDVGVVKELVQQEQRAALEADPLHLMVPFRNSLPVPETVC